jgi:PiT family inorganic phosphate transporter
VTLGLPFIIFVIIIALAFDFTNGMHDAANSISTVVSTRVLSPRVAVIWAAFFNFIAFLIFGTTVASTIGKGMIDINAITPTVILAGLLGAIATQGQP